MNGALLSSKNMGWCTPADFFRELDQEFHFNLDPAATDKSAKCARYFTPADDGLKADWGGCRVFCNPPYGRQINEWVRKGYEESKKPGTLVVMLIPARTDTSYFHDYIFHGKADEVRFVRGRITFTDEDGNPTKDAKGRPCSAPFPSAVVIWRSKDMAQSLRDMVLDLIRDRDMTANEIAATKRQINIAIKFAPNKSRQVINTQISVTTKLAATEAIDTQMVMGVNMRTGQIEIAEYDGQIRGQMNLSDFTEEEPQPKEHAGQQEVDPAEAEREQDIPTGAPIDMRRRKPEPRQQAEADPEAAGHMIPGKDFDPVTGEIYEPEDDRRTTDGQTEEQPKNDGKIVVMERAAAQA